MLNTVKIDNQKEEVVNDVVEEVPAVPVKQQVSAVVHILADTGSPVDGCGLEFAEKFGQDRREGKASALCSASGHDVTGDGRQRWFKWMLDDGATFVADMHVLNMTRPIFSVHRAWKMRKQSYHFPSAEDPEAYFVHEGKRYNLVEKGGQWYLPLRLVRDIPQEKQTTLQSWIHCQSRQRFPSGTWWSGAARKPVCFRKSFWKRSSKHCGLGSLIPIFGKRRIHGVGLCGCFIVDGKVGRFCGGSVCHVRHG